MWVCVCVCFIFIFIPVLTLWKAHNLRFLPLLPLPTHQSSNPPPTSCWIRSNQRRTPTQPHNSERIPFVWRKKSIENRNRVLAFVAEQREALNAHCHLSSATDAAESITLHLQFVTQCWRPTLSLFGLYLFVFRINVSKYFRQQHEQQQQQQQQRWL